MQRTTTQAPTTGADAGARESSANGASVRAQTDDEILGILNATQPTNPQSPADAKGNRRVRLQPVRNDRKDALRGTAQQESGPAQAEPGGGPTRETPPLQEGNDAAASPSQEMAAEPEELQAIFEANPELRQAWHMEKAYREIFPNVEAAREIAGMFPTVEQARAAQSQLAELEQLDSWFFSGQPDAHAELAATVYRMNPAAFRSLAQAINQTLARLDAAGKPAGKPEPRLGDATASAPNDKATTAAPDAQQAGRFASFYQETNAAVVEGVVDAIRAQVDRLLPEGAAAGARNRVVGEIYRELDASLRSNRALAQQVRQAFRSGAMDADHQAAVAGLILGRAKQALPAVAKRVINEWTTGVLAASDAKLARQRAAQGRVDITGGGAPGTVPKQSLSPKEIDYSKLSDADILNL